MSNAYYRKLNTLRNYNLLCKRIEDLTDDYCELLTKATKINQTLHDDTGPANHDNQSKVENITILLAEKKKKIERAIEERDKIDNALKILSARDEYLIRKTVINTYSLNSVSKELQMNYKYAINLRAKIIKRLEL